MKAQANDLQVLSGIPHAPQQHLSSDLLLRQILHGPIVHEKALTRPKEGDDIRMLDITGTMEHRLNFLPGLYASRHAPKEALSVRTEEDKKARIVIDRDGIVKLRNGDAGLEAVMDEEISPVEQGPTGRRGSTYADIMAEANARTHFSDDEMEWE
jgi:hypothetical protein